jgi:hypothetical protein
MSFLQVIWGSSKLNLVLHFVWPATIYIIVSGPSIYGHDRIANTLIDEVVLPLWVAM